jgi:hypothetical protein
MKLKIFFTIFPFVFISGCGLLFRPGIDKAVDTLSHGFVPDSCDINLIYSIVEFRTDSLRFPTYSWTIDRVQLQTNECQASFDSINVFSFGLDSLDIFLIKNYINMENERYSMRKYYRLRFTKDSLNSITPYLITSKDKYY